MDVYRAIVDKRDQRAFPAHLPEAEVARLLGIPEALHVNRVIGLGYVDPARRRPPSSVARRRLPLTDLVHRERW
jgi:hypothetical protein